MPETYNPRERTFIKRPEPKVCVTCGQPIAPDVKPLTNHMNRYVNDISGRVVILNSNEQYVNVQGVDLRREDIPVGTPVPVKEVVINEVKPGTLLPGPDLKAAPLATKPLVDVPTK